MKKKIAITLSAVLLSTATLAALTLNSNNINNLIKAETDKPYSLTIDAPLYTGAGESGEGYAYVQTAFGNSVKIKYDKLSPYASGINNIKQGSYIEIVSNNDIEGLTGIIGVTIKSVINDASCYLNVSYGWNEGVMVNNIQQLSLYGESNLSFELPNSPSYIRIDSLPYAYSYNIDLKEIVITYSCQKTIEPYIEGDYCFIYNEDHYEVSRYRGLSTELTIPDNYKGNTVTAVADDFIVDIGKEDITSVTLPESITRLGRNAFSGAENMTTINLENVADFDYRALFNCTKFASTVNSINLYATHIGQNAISQTGVKIINFHSPTKALSIDADAFSNDDALVRVFFDYDIVLRIGSTLFRSCDNLDLVSLPRSINTLYDDNYLEPSTFNGCTKLNYIRYNGTAEEWGNITKPSTWHNDIIATVVHCNFGIDVPIE